MTDKMFMGASTKQGMDIATKSRDVALLEMMSKI